MADIDALIAQAAQMHPTACPPVRAIAQRATRKTAVAQIPLHEYQKKFTQSLGVHYGNQSRRDAALVASKMVSEREGVEDIQDALVLVGVGLGIGFGVAGAFAITTGGAVAAAVMGTSIPAFLSHVTSELSDHSLEQGRLGLSLELKALRQENVDLFNRVLGGTPEERRDHLNQFAEGYFSQAPYDDLTPEAKQAFMEVRGAALEAYVVKSNELQALIDEGQDKDIAKLRGQVDSIAHNQQTIFKQLNQHSEQLKTVSAHVGKIQKSMADLSADVATLKGGVALNQKNIQFLSAMMFGNVSPKEQLALLESEDTLAHIEGEEREALKKRIEIAQERVEMAELAGKAIKGLQTFALVAEKLDIFSEDTIKVAGDIAKYSSVALNVGMALTSGPGGIMNAVQALSGLFGGPSPHEQIMGSLNTLLNGQQRILNQIFELRRQIHNLARQIAHQHQEVMGKLEDIHIDILINRELIKDLLEDPLVESRQFLDSRNEDPYYRFDGTEFLDYEGMNFHFESHYDEFHRGILELEGYLKKSSLHTIFRNDAYSGAQTGLKEQIGRINHLTVLIYRLLPDVAQFHGLESLSDLTPLMWSPVSSFRTLDLKMARIPDSPINDYARGVREFAAKHLERSLATATIQEVAEIMLESHVYYQLSASLTSDQLKSLEALVSHKPKSRRGMPHLKAMLRIVQTGIAQQALLSGDVLLPFLYNRLKALQSKKPNELKELDWTLMELIARNSLLRHNLGRYLVWRELKASGHNAWSYDVFLNTGLKSSKTLGPDDDWSDETKNLKDLRNSLLPEALASGWNLRMISIREEQPSNDQDDEETPTPPAAVVSYHWAIPIPWRDDKGKKHKAYLRLPPGEAIWKDSFRYSPAVETLVGLRSELSATIVQYNLTDRLPTEGSKAFYNALATLPPQAPASL